MSLFALSTMLTIVRADIIELDPLGSSDPLPLGPVEVASSEGQPVRLLVADGSVPAGLAGVDVDIAEREVGVELSHAVGSPHETG